MELENYLYCPNSKDEIEISYEDNTVYVKNSNRTYPIKDAIIDFIPDVNDKISDSYDSVSSAYNSLLTGSNIFSRVYNAIVWGLNDEEYVNQVLDYIPDDFNGVLLDVPVGSGVFTYEKYAKINDAKIICVDYSLGMLQEAKKVYERNNIKNVSLIRADVTNLPLKNSSVDLILTMNGLHAFPDKSKAIDEINRVLKKRSDLLGCFYVKEKRKFSDLFVNNIYVKQGTFTSPFYSEREFVHILKNDYDFVDKNSVKSIFYFHSLKK